MEGSLEKNSTHSHMADIATISRTRSGKGDNIQERVTSGMGDTEGQQLLVSPDSSAVKERMFGQIECTLHLLDCI